LHAVEDSSAAQAQAAASGDVFQNGGAAEANLFSAAPDISLTPPQSTVAGGEQGEQV